MFLDFLFKKEETTKPVVQKDVQQKTTDNKKTERKGALGEYKFLYLPCSITFKLLSQIGPVV